ncbi:MAG: glucose-6-phosphate isomerase [Bacillus thermozeamaize]|uniref:Glucose-6-phosphate isomerase n=1 Tax=Bacillus thermozeamaize TaxID=230954 RepID=A0A1Y3PNL6_9BACI|nr:MAG: glucose-6-phosphate isomerase [Bacillus thermozeamaize]
MGQLILDDAMALPFVDGSQLERLQPQVSVIHRALHERQESGLGWVDYPLREENAYISRILETADMVRRQADVLLVIGIGGSYIGSRAAIEMLPTDGPAILYAGYQLSSLHLVQVMGALQGKDVFVNVISKSGATLEPSLVFRIIWPHLVERYGEAEAARRILVTTGSCGPLRKQAEQAGFPIFSLPEDIGGRYSVLTAVGLLPMAVAGIDINAVMRGARDAALRFQEPDLSVNPAYRYAVYRNLFYRQGKIIELLITYEPSLYALSEWWKQLFSESEGKHGQGIFPTAAQFTTDLHSLGQYIQQGRRLLFETIVDIHKLPVSVKIPKGKGNDDGLDFLADQTLDWVNRKALEATRLAHADGGVPNLVVRLPELNAYWFGQLIYFFQKACAMSGYLAGVNPFDQPGVEAYKQYLSAILGRPGYETLQKDLEQRLQRMGHRNG